MCVVQCIFLSMQNAAYADKPIFPVGSLEAGHTDRLSRSGAVDKALAAGVNPGVQTAWAGADAKNHNIPRSGIIDRDPLPGLGLIRGNAGDLDAVLAICPPNQS